MASCCGYCFSYPLVFGWKFARTAARRWNMAAAEPSPAEASRSSSATADGAFAVGPAEPSAKRVKRRADRLAISDSSKVHAEKEAERDRGTQRELS